MKPVFLLLFLLTISFSSLEAQAKRGKFWSNVNYELSLGAGISPNKGAYKVNTLESMFNIGTTLIYKKHNINLGLSAFYARSHFRESYVRLTYVTPNGIEWIRIFDENGNYFITFSYYHQLVFLKYMYSVLNPKSNFDFQLGVGTSYMFLSSEWSHSFDSLTQHEANSQQWNERMYGSLVRGLNNFNLDADLALFYKISSKIKVGLCYGVFFNLVMDYNKVNVQNLINIKISIKI